MNRYDPRSIEPKWQEKWAADSRYVAKDSDTKQKYYVSGMFPYPSGAGMHTGHFFEHSIVDAVARFRRALGYNVMYPMGWDSFGLPAENYAIKTGKTPHETTQTNIANFKNQLTANLPPQKTPNHHPKLLPPPQLFQNRSLCKLSLAFHTDRLLFCPSLLSRYYLPCSTVETTKTKSKSKVQKTPLIDGAF